MFLQLATNNTMTIKTILYECPALGCLLVNIRPKTPMVKPAFLLVGICLNSSDHFIGMPLLNPRGLFWFQKRPSLSQLHSPLPVNHLP